MSVAFNIVAYTHILSRAPSRLFALDCIGAVLSALLLGVALPQFHTFLGVSVEILYELALVASGLALYSLGCYSIVRFGFAQTILHLLLYILALANAIYCIYTASIILRMYAYISSIGIAYFVIEIIIILLLVGIELYVASHHTP
jgi:hypothetical protein